MDWYVTHKFLEYIELLEKFLVEMAANESHIRRRGLKVALQLDSAEKGLEAINLFCEEFSRIRRSVATIDKALFSEIQAIESEGRLLEQIPLIALALKMARVRYSGGNGADQARPYVGLMASLYPRRTAFGEGISLQRTIISLGRLRSPVKVLQDILRQTDSDDNDVVKPSNVDKVRVIHLIDSAIESLGAAQSVSAVQRDQITAYLRDAKTELQSSRPAWSKIVGVLVIVAAITTGISDAPGAIKNVKDAIEHILGTSVDKADKRSLPIPESTPSTPGFLPVRI